MFSTYMKAALGLARYEMLKDDKAFYAEIPNFEGVYAHANTLERCRDELETVLEEWILFRIANHLPMPVVKGLSLEIKQRKVA